MRSLYNKLSFIALLGLQQTKKRKMAKLYSECPQKQNNLNPKEETIDFLLNYSKALSVIECNNLKFEALQN